PPPPPRTPAAGGPSGVEPAPGATRASPRKRPHRGRAPTAGLHPLPGRRGKGRASTKSGGCRTEGKNRRRRAASHPKWPRPVSPTGSLPGLPGNRRRDGCEKTLPCAGCPPPWSVDPPHHPRSGSFFLFQIVHEDHPLLYIGDASLLAAAGEYLRLP